MSHTVIIHGGAYDENTPPAPGQISAEIRWTPSHDLTEAEQGKQFARILKKLNNLYAVGEEPAA